MNRTYKIIASRGAEIVFDERVVADSPRQARRELKQRLGLGSLSGLVYSITEIPVALIRELVDARVAELAGGATLPTPVPADVEALVSARLAPVLARLAALENRGPAEPEPVRFDPLANLAEPMPAPEPSEPPEPNWALVRRHFRRYRDPARTAAKYGVPLSTLRTRARREGWES